MKKKFGRIDSLFDIEIFYIPQLTNERNMTKASSNVLFFFPITN